MTNPFDWRTVLLAKHAQHVVLIHFPIALFIVGVAFDFLAVWTKRQVFGAAALLNLSAAAVTVFPTLLSGLIAWQWQLEGQRLKGILLYHLLFASVSAPIVLLSWWIHFRARRPDSASLPFWRFPLELLGVLSVTLTGHLGGFLSGVNS
ncbi:MAG: DUF2231 domain-containing protein [Candidatus Acidiferrum sp.]